MSSYGRIYFVTFEIHRDCKIFDYVFHCWAYDAKEAKELAKKAWSEGHKSHQFHLYAKRSKAPDDKFLKVVCWQGTAFSGKDCIDKFLCTDFRTWRVNGINQYGTNKGLPYWS